MSNFRLRFLLWLRHSVECCDRRNCSTYSSKRKRELQRYRRAPDLWFVSTVFPFIGAVRRKMKLEMAEDSFSTGARFQILAANSSSRISPEEMLRSFNFLNSRRAPSSFFGTRELWLTPVWTNISDAASRT